MVDNLSKENRSKVMSSIKGKHTKPELILRKIIWAYGARYRIHDKTVFGTPDISNKRKKIAVFIDGCFWHGCRTCYKEPTTNILYWGDKIKRNKERRRIVRNYLSSKSWTVIELWEHEIRDDPTKLIGKILSYF